MMTKSEEFSVKVEKVRELVSEKGVGGVEVGTQANFAWLTCGGRGFINMAGEGACATILVTKDNVFLLVDRIEASRLVAEELSGLAGELEVKVFPWEELDRSDQGLYNDILNGEPFLTDTWLAPEFEVMRSSLTGPEIERYAHLCRDTAEALEQCCKGLRPGVSEFETAGMLGSELWVRGVEPIVLLIAFDERIELFRHPLPTATRLENTAMVVACGRRHGLIASATRLASVRGISSELAQKHSAVVEVDAHYICGTVPGAIVGDIFSDAVEVYREKGYADEWRLHHQGGLTGYSAREFFGTANNKRAVLVNQVFAWNPSITGTKSEDTILVTESGPEILTHTGKYPYIEVRYGDSTIKRPDILKL